MLFHPNIIMEFCHISEPFFIWCFGNELAIKYVFSYIAVSYTHLFMDVTSIDGEAHYGMGLFFAKTVAEKYGGGIKLSNSENTGGARVEIFFLSSQETS